MLGQPRKPQNITTKPKKKNFQWGTAGVCLLCWAHTAMRGTQWMVKRGRRGLKLKHTDWEADSERASCGQVPWICHHVHHQFIQWVQSRPGEAPAMLSETENKTPVGVSRFKTHQNTASRVQLSKDVVLNPSAVSSFIVFCCLHWVSQHFH